MHRSGSAVRTRDLHFALVLAKVPLVLLVLIERALRAVCLTTYADEPTIDLIRCPADALLRFVSAFPTSGSTILSIGTMVHLVHVATTIWVCIAIAIRASLLIIFGIQSTVLRRHFLCF